MSTTIQRNAECVQWIARETYELPELSDEQVQQIMRMSEEQMHLTLAREALRLAPTVACDGGMKMYRPTISNGKITGYAIEFEDSDAIVECHSGSDAENRNNAIKFGAAFAMFEALQAIANDPHCVYTETGGGSYGTGVADGHRCAATKARAALALAKEAQDE